MTSEAESTCNKVDRRLFFFFHIWSRQSQTYVLKEKEAMDSTSNRLFWSFRVVLNDVS